MKLKRIPRALRMMRDSMLERSRLKQTRPRQPEIRFDSHQRIQLPYSIIEPVTLTRLDADTGFVIEVSLSEADTFIDELDAICQYKKDRTELKIGRHNVVIERSRDAINIFKKLWFLRNYFFGFKVESVSRVVQEYRIKRQNYGPDGTYQVK